MRQGPASLDGPQMTPHQPRDPRARPDPRDPRSLRTHAPLFDAWLAFQERGPAPFTIPGHKQRTDLVGDIVRGDVPLYAGLDSMKLSAGVLAEAERRAAELWAADVCRFSVGGSTHGNQALALAVARPGDRVVVQRTLHRSLLLGLVLAGLEPVWVLPDVDPITGMPVGVHPAALAAALRDAPDAKAVFVTDPSYVGTVGSPGELASLTQAHGIPLVVDAAWAAHFGFHPDLPHHALALGADALVTSAHKTLPAWSQGALILARGERIDLGRLDAAVEATHTTSPAGAILASIDAAVALLARDGQELLGRLLDVVALARARLAQVPGLVVMDGPRVDPAKLVLLLAGTGADGNAVEAGLIERGLPVEMADRDAIVAMVTMADDEGTVGRFVDAVVNLVETLRGEPRPTVPAAAWTVEPAIVCPPREAFFAAHQAVRTDAAVGRVSAELIAPYPPGVPVLSPGERVTAQVLAALASARAAGVRIAYAADPTLATLRVLA
jgi:arginine decarboxylase